MTTPGDQTLEETEPIEFESYPWRHQEKGDQVVSGVQNGGKIDSRATGSPNRGIRHENRPEAVFNSAFGQAVREARRRAGISQEELAFRSGVSVTHVSRVERAYRGWGCGLYVARNFAQAIGVTLGDLIAETERIANEQG